MSIKELKRSLIKKPLHGCKPFFDQKLSGLLSPQSKFEK